MVLRGIGLTLLHREVGGREVAEVGGKAKEAEVVVIKMELAGGVQVENHGMELAGAVQVEMAGAVQVELAGAVPGLEAEPAIGDLKHRSVKPTQLVKTENP